MKTCICCLIKDTPDYLLKEFIDYHYNLQIDDIYFIVDSGSKPVYQDNKCTYINIDSINDLPNYNLKQLRVYNWFLEKYRNDYDWIFYIDDDEFVHMNLKYLSKFNDYDCVVLPWRMLISNKISKDTQLSEFTQYKFSSNMKYSLANFQYNVVKSIVNTHKCKYIKHAHFANDNWKSFVMDKSEQLSKQLYTKLDNAACYIDHYYIRSFQEWVERVYDRKDLYMRDTNLNFKIPNRNMEDYYIMIEKNVSITDLINDLSNIKRFDIINKIKQDPIKYAFRIKLDDCFLKDFDSTYCKLKYGNDFEIYLSAYKNVD